MCSCESEHLYDVEGQLGNSGSRGKKREYDIRSECHYEIVIKSLCAGVVGIIRLSPTVKLICMLIYERVIIGTLRPS